MKNRADVEVEQPAPAVIPERALLRAILCRALLDTGMFGGHYKPIVSRIAVDYVFSNDESEFSFVWCAQYHYQTAKQTKHFIRRSRVQLSQFLSDGIVRLENPMRNPGSNGR